MSEHPTSQKREGLSAAKRALLEKRLRGRAATPDETPGIPRRSQVGPAPLSFAQERLWLIDQVAPSSPVYNIPVAYRLTGRLNVDALRQSLHRIAERHAILRTTIAADGGQPVQVVADEINLPLPVEDLGDVPAAERADAARRRSRALVPRPFDLERGPLLRSRLLHLSETEHHLVMSFHHAVFDGWSLGTFTEELSALYAAFSDDSLSEDQLAPLSEPPIQYADYAVWQRERLRGDALEEHLDYWKEQLGGPLPVLELPTDRPRPSAQTYRGALHRFALPADLTDKLRALAREENTTLFTALLAAFEALLHRYTGQDDFVVGTPVAGRDHSALEDLMGFFVNTLALRADCSGDPGFRTLLGRVRETTLGAFAHQEAPFEKLVDALQPERDLSRTPLFQVLFAFQSEPRPTPDLPGLEAEWLHLHTATAKCDLQLFLSVEDGRLRGELEYSTDLFDAATIEHMAGCFETLLRGLAREPERPLSALPLLAPALRQQMLVEWNRTDAPIPERPIHRLIAEHAQRAPHRTAVIDKTNAGTERLSYADLWRRAGQVARRLKAAGVGPADRVGLLAERSAALVVGALGALRAGAAYVPLDPSYPDERLRYMLEDSGAQVVVAQDGLETEEAHAAAVRLGPGGRLMGSKASSDQAAPLDEAAPGDLAYVIYTSGSTGRPKGVMIEHRSLANLVGWHQREYKLTPDDRATLLASPSFDASVWELWPYLAAGASLHIPDADTRLAPAQLAQWLADEAITAAFLPTPLAEAALKQAFPEHPALRFMLTGGDRLHRVKRASLPFALVNHYGPTENTVVATRAAVAPGEGEALPPIGRPIANVQAFVLDAHGQPVPPGVPGELYLGGAGLARGYLGRPNLTAERFVAHPFRDGERLYRTGDRVRWRADGQLDFLGRLDRQVKLRGYRIELGEIEAALREHSAVEDAVAMVRGALSGRNGSPGGPERLVAYVAATPHVETGTDGWRAFLANRLPSYMVPTAFVELDALPLTPNGKVDRDALPTPEPAVLTPEAAYAAPQSPTETKLARICCRLLGIERIGRHDNIFDLGANSLLAVQISAEASNAGLPLTPRHLFEHQTIAELAASQLPHTAGGDGEARASEHLAFSASSGDQPISEDSSVVAIQPDGSLPPLFSVGVFVFRKLARHLDPEQPFYGLLRKNLHSEAATPNRRVEDIAADYLRDIRAVQPTGPYHLGGFCFGGLVALEMAQQLRAQGEDVGLLVFIDTENPHHHNPVEAPSSTPSPAPPHTFKDKLKDHYRQWQTQGWSYLREWADLKTEHWYKKVANQLRKRLGRAYMMLSRPVPVHLRGILTIDADGWAAASYEPASYDGPVTLFLGTGGDGDPENNAANRQTIVEGWRLLIKSDLRVIELSGNHIGNFEEPHVHHLADQLHQHLHQENQRARPQNVHQKSNI